MSFTWAVEQLLAGKRVRRMGWVRFELALKLDEGGALVLVSPGMKPTAMVVYSRDMTADDWTVAE